MILAGPRQSRHHDHLAGRVVKRQVIRVTVYFAKVPKSAVIARELARRVQTPLFEAVLGEESDVVEQFPPVVANSTPRVGFGAKRQRITARGLAGGKQRSPRVGAVNQEKRDLVVTNQIGDLLTSLKRQAHPPEQLSSHYLAAF